MPRSYGNLGRYAASTSSPTSEWMSSITEQIEVAAHASVVQVAEEAAQMIRDYTYPNRKLTRESVRVVITGPRTATVGLYFGRKYTTNKNSFTYRHFRETCDHIRPILARRFPEIMNSQLQTSSGR